MSTMTKDQLGYQQKSARIYQQRYDDTLRKVGMRAPQPVLGQDPDDYRRENSAHAQEDVPSESPARHHQHARPPRRSLASV